MSKRRARRALTFDDVRTFALTLPGVEAGTMYGAPAVKFRGHLLACMTTHKSAEPGTLAVRLDVPDRDELIAAEPDVYYLKDHYVDYACVLVRLSRVHPDALRDLLRASWRFVSVKGHRTKRTRARHPASHG